MTTRGRKPRGARADELEAYMPDHARLADADLLLPPPEPFTRLVLFTCTYVADLDGLRMGLQEITRRMCEAPHGCLVAINTNYGHAAQEGFEGHLKHPKPPAPVVVDAQYVPRVTRARALQGDGTCFNSAIEPVISVDYPGRPLGKVYQVKCFPTTGKTQIPGVIRPDRSDGHLVLDAFVTYLNELGLGAGGGPVTIKDEHPNMINYKMRLVRSTPRMLVDLFALAGYLGALEGARLSTADDPDTTPWPEDEHGPLVLPPFVVHETKPPTDDVKVSFRFACDKRQPRINVFQEGKVNILGADSESSAVAIHAYFAELFATNWDRLVCLQPRADRAARLALPPAPAAPAPLFAAGLLDDFMFSDGDT